MASAKKRITNAFTLIEILAILGVIGILSGFLFSFLGGATDKVHYSKTRLQLLAYAQALENYYNYYKSFPSFLIKEEPINIKDNTECFIKMLSGKGIYGEKLTDKEVESLNPHEILFYKFAHQEYDINKGCIVDSFKNCNIFVKVRPHSTPFIQIQAMQGKISYDRAVLYSTPYGDESGQDTMIIHTWE